MKNSIFMRVSVINISPNENSDMEYGTLEEMINRELIFNCLSVGVEFMEDFDLKAAHEVARFNRDILAKDCICGCFCCLQVFSTSEINEWCAEEYDGEEVTAICPYCGVDAVLSESFGYPLTDDFLGEMKERWFG